MFAKLTGLLILFFICNVSATTQWLPDTRRTIDIGTDSYSVQTSGAPHSLQRARNCQSLQRFVLRPGDQWPLDPPTSERTELSSKFSINNFEEVHISYDFSVDKGLPSVSPWAVLGQFHATEDFGDNPVSPPWALELRGEKIFLVLRTSKSATIKNSPPPIREYLVIRRVKEREWYNIRSDTIFDWRESGSGSIRMWINNKLVVNNNIPIGYNDIRGPYWKFGIYRFRNQNTIQVTYRNMYLNQSRNHKVLGLMHPKC